ncbi:MAG: trypsin-like peptidase domain-containing protein [Candidatus Electrothrix aestuarii]|uniref:Trypsin-like peptidase domain-containing protein n=1 Tax=Candidatus Electrothrix aestuarii TaxID=3062594 RepID=A0AAU8LYP8_9BACT|nr:trypsin-like peptidase domain-containing protein [Candidatus Electrothrix aestuarii]
MSSLYVYPSFPMTKYYPLFLLLFLFGLESSLFAHELYLKDGRVINTSNVWRDGDTVHYEQYGGTISISYTKVKGVVYDTPQEAEENVDPEITSGGQSEGEAGKRSIPPEKDLAAKLTKALAPKTPVERASMCTLSVKTAAGFGSGFFLSDDGYIITNRHVVRGSEKQKQKVETTIEQNRQNLRRYKRSLDTAEKQYKIYRDDLEEKEALLKELRQAGQVERAYFKAKQQELYEAEKRLRREEQRLAKAEKEYRSKKKAFDKQAEKFFRSQRELARQGSFTIILADETELYASLYRISDDHDLALLKISGYKTPFLHPVQQKELAQGQKVFAVGSPVDLKLKNTVTSGILSAFRDNFVQTNAQIYPGNSGGPLIDSEGRVIGVNTKKLLTRKFEGLGFAIPINLVFSEFEDYLLHQ